MPSNNVRYTHRSTAFPCLAACSAASLFMLGLSSASAAEPLKVCFLYSNPIGESGWTYQHELARKELVAALGGTTFPVPKNQRRLGQVRYEALAEVIGVDGADALTRHFGGEILSIPKCEAALRELRDRAVRAEFDTITRDHPAVHAVTQLARKYRLTDRHIWRLLNRVDRETLPQARLF